MVLKITDWVSGVRRVAERFPYTVALLGALYVVMLAWVHMEWSGSTAVARQNAQRLAMALFAGVFISIAWKLFVEGRTELRNRREVEIAGFVAIFALQVLMYFTMLRDLSVTAPLATINTRYTILVVVSFFAMLIAPFCKLRSEGDAKKFFQWSFSVLTQFAVAFGMGILLGILGALMSWALYLLFDMDDTNELLFLYWSVTVAIVLMPLYFMSHIPGKFDLEFSEKMPLWMNILFAKILLYFTLLYMVVLYAFGMKVLIGGDWPEGTIAPLVLAFLLLGWGVYYVLRFYEGVKSDSLVSWFVRWYPAISVPPVLLLMKSLQIRIAAYGISVDRYYGLLIGLWLLLLSGYFMFSKKRDLRVIFISFIVLFLATLYGPHSPYSVDLRAQRGRLESTLKHEVGWVDGEVPNHLQVVEYDVYADLQSTVEHMIAYHGLDSFKPYLGEDGIKEVKERPGGDSLDSDYIFRWSLARVVLDTMGVKDPVSVYEELVDDDEFDPTKSSFPDRDTEDVSMVDFFPFRYVSPGMYDDDAVAISVEGFEYVGRVKFEHISSKAVQQRKIEVSDHEYVSISISGDGKIVLQAVDDRLSGQRDVTKRSVEIQFGKLLEEMYREDSQKSPLDNDISAEAQMEIKFDTNDGFNGKMVVESVTGHFPVDMESADPTVEALTATVLFNL